MVEQRRACLGQLVQHERTTGDLGEDGEQPGAGRGLQNPIGRRDGRRGGDREAKRDRRRELLERLALLGATRVGGEKARDLREHRQCGGRRRRLYGEALCRICGGTAPSPPHRRRRRFSNPRRRPHRRRRRPPPSRCAGYWRRCGDHVRDREGEAARPGRWRRMQLQAMAQPKRATAELEGFVMKGTSGERERAEPPGALSRPDQLKPVPADLSLSSRCSPHGAPPRDARFPRRIRDHDGLLKRQRPAQWPGVLGMDGEASGTTFAAPLQAVTRRRSRPARRILRRRCFPRHRRGRRAAPWSPQRCRRRLCRRVRPPACAAVQGASRCR